MVLLICKLYDILSILNCLHCGPCPIIWPHKGSEPDKGLYILLSNCLRSSWELWSLICDMAIKSSCYKTGSMLNIRISGEKLGNIFLQIYSYSTTYDSIKLIVAHVSDVAHGSGPLV